MKFQEFMEQTHVRNIYVSEQGWLALYVRRGPRYINGVKREDVIDLANLEAAHPGQGTFKKLIERIRREYPEYTIYIENVMTARFVEGLDRMGFKLIEPMGLTPCFYMDPVK